MIRRKLLIVVAAAAFTSHLATMGVAQEGRARIRSPGAAFRADTLHPLFNSFVFGRRAWLGLTVNLQAAETDRYGALIDAVTPDGPAHQAGIVAGDIVVRLSDQSLLEPTPDEHQIRDYERSLPGLRLVSLAARLEPNDTIEVELLRDQKPQVVRLVTAEGPDMVRSWRLPGGEVGYEFRGDSITLQFQEDRTLRRRMSDEALWAVPFRRQSPEADFFFYAPNLFELELAPINPQLGRYFGTEKGILVIRAPTETGLGLQGGDVVLMVDGREPLDPPHLHRIFRSYQAGEKFTLTIMRDGKRQQVEGALPGRPRR